MTGTLIREIALLTTTDLQSARIDELKRLFDSVEQIRQSRPDLPIRHALLLQRCDDVAAGIQRVGAPAWMDVSAVDRQVPLSVARNMMLDTLFDAGIADDSVVAFPDDDAWYPAGLFEHALAQFDARPSLDFWFCRYGSEAQFDANVASVTPALQQVLSYGSSNTILLRGKLLKAIGGFDEGLGLGTPAKSGEDTEFAMRAWLGAREVAFENAKMIGHRDFSPEVRAKYYGGSLLAIARHANRSGAGRVALARKLLVGVALTGKRQLPLGDMLRAWRTVLQDDAGSAVSTIRPSAIKIPARGGVRSKM